MSHTKIFAHALAILFMLTVFGSCRTYDRFFGFDESTPQSVIDYCKANNPQAKKDSCDIITCFSDPLTLLALPKLLEVTDRVLAKHGVPYILEGGTLVAALRGPQPLVWDDDNDLVVLSKDYEGKEKAIAKDLNSLGYEIDNLYTPNAIARGIEREGIIQVSLTYPTFVKIATDYAPTISKEDLDTFWERYRARGKLGPHLDILLFDEFEPGKYSYRSKLFRDSLGLFDKDMLFPPSKLPFIGKEFNAPRDTKGYLNKLYKTDQIVKDVVIFNEHGRKCLEKIRFKNTDDVPEFAPFVKRYSDHVFNKR